MREWILSCDVCSKEIARGPKENAWARGTLSLYGSVLLDGRQVATLNVSEFRAAADVCSKACARARVQRLLDGIDACDAAEAP